MAKKKSLVIVESPAKAKTINKYLGDDFIVKASMGHVRDLPSKGINVDIENDFTPTYDIMTGKKRTVISLKAAAKKCDKLFLATDLDREGEAIAWHLSEILDFDESVTYRVVFNAITRSSIEQAFANVCKLNVDKVMAQQARRILDRIVGYQISPLLWKKVARGLSAGRVQSVAVKMVVDKERQISAFDPQEYWLMPAVFTSDLSTDHSQMWQEFMATKSDKDKSPTLAQQSVWLGERQAFKAELYSVAGEKFEKTNETQTLAIYKSLANADFAIDDISTKQSTSRPAAPFTTSTLQQAAANRLGFATKRTMRIAQQLYEGIELGAMGSIGLITYMRTDSTHLSSESLANVRNHIENSFGEKYLPAKPNFFAAKANAQAAHEAIHPTDADLSPADIAKYLNDEQYKLYDLIWRRFVASQMSPSKWDVTTLAIAADTTSGKCVYKTSGRVLVFDGFSRVWTTASLQQQLPSLEIGQAMAAISLEAQQHFTKPPARYNEASLVKALEKEGIGRPSTYASIISTIQDRRYVEQLDRKFFATDLGIVVTDKLGEFFPKTMDIPFTRHMEQELDKIEEQHLDWVGVLKDFYGPFKENLDKAMDQMQHAKAETTPSEYKCPDCKSDMVYRFGKNGRFLSCGDYPTCTYACPCDRDGKMTEPKESDSKCPNCDKPMMYKRGRFGEFLGCSGYPDCKTILNLDKDGNVLPPKPPPEPTGIKCYKCKTGELVIRQSKRGPFMGCNKFPRCRTIISMKQLDNLKQLQEEGKWPPKTFEEADIMLGRKKAKKTKKAKKVKKAKKATATKKAAASKKTESI